jgi:hypothetical protein
VYVNILQHPGNYIFLKNRKKLYCSEFSAGSKLKQQIFQMLKRETIRNLISYYLCENYNNLIILTIAGQQGLAQRDEKQISIRGSRYE